MTSQKINKYRILKLVGNIIIATVVGIYFIGILVLLLNSHFVLQLGEFLLLIRNISLFYFPLIFILLIILFFVFQFFSEKKYPVGFLQPASPVYFTSFVLALISIIYFFNYEYYKFFFPLELKKIFLKILLLNILVVLVAILYIFFHLRQKVVIIGFYVLLLLALYQPLHAVVLKNFPLASNARMTLNPDINPIQKKIHIVIMNSLSLNFLNTLQTEKPLMNLNHLLKNGVRGNIETFKPNFDLALFNSALSGLEPSHFTHHSDLNYKFVDLEEYDFQLFPRYLFFRNLQVTRTLSFFNDHSFSVLDNIRSYYEINNQKVFNMVKSENTPIYFKKSLRYNDSFKQLQFYELLQEETKKSEILKNSFFSDEYIKDRMNQNINQSDYSIISFPGLKFINKYFYHYIYPIYENISPEKIKQYKWVIQHYYDYYDSIIGNLLSSIREDELLVIISFYEYELLPIWRKILLEFLGKKDIYVYKDLDSQGSIFFYERNAIKKDYPLQTISIFDIFPTLLYYAELPIPFEARGNVIREMFTDDFVLRNPINIESRSAY